MSKKHKTGIVAEGIADVKTGVWRSERPVVDKDKCIGCGVCVMYCPVGAIKKGKPVEIDYEYCKGCGICVTTCVPKALSMEKENG